MITCAITTNAAQTLTKGTYNEINFFQYTGFFYQALSMFPENTQGMRFVYNQIVAIGFFNVNNIYQGCTIAKHAVDTFNHDQSIGRPVTKSL